MFFPCLSPAPAVCCPVVGLTMSRSPPPLPTANPQPAATAMSSHSMLTCSAAPAALAALAPSRPAVAPLDVDSDDEIVELFPAATTAAAGDLSALGDSSDDDIVQLCPPALGPDGLPPLSSSRLFALWCLWSCFSPGTHSLPASPLPRCPSAHQRCPSPTCLSLLFHLPG